MPELKLFKRRWHTATDALPLLFFLLCIFHILWFVPYATGAYSIESTGLKYECSHATELRVANYSLFATFGLAAINEGVLTVLGLRGGPFETRKRRFMTPLLYLEVVLWGLLLAFTIYATVTVYSPAVADSCWSNNPCLYNPDVFPLACRGRQGKGEVRALPETCQNLLRAGPNFMYCWLTWLANGANWAGTAVHEIVAFFARLAEEDPTGLYISPEGAVNVTDTATARVVAEWLVCFIRSKTSEDVLESLLDLTTGTTDVAEAEELEFVREYADLPNLNCTGVLQNWDSGGFSTRCNATQDPVFWNQTLEIQLDVSGGPIVGEDGNVLFDIPDFSISDYNAFLREHPDLFQYYNQQMLEAIRATGIQNLGIGGSFNLSTATDTPWFSCLNATCQEQTYWADECKEWAQILALPLPKNSKPFFEILVITSWTVLAITALVLFLCFNAFPDYNDVDSWEGTLRSIDRMCLCGGGLAGSATVSGSDMSVSREIAKSLNLLFGGIDMDPTDRLLGVYLVSERQHRRRQSDVLAALQKAGIVTEQKGKRSRRLLDALSRLDPRRSARRTQQRQQPGSPEATLAPQPDWDDKGAAGCDDGAEPPMAVPLSSSSGGGSSRGGPGPGLEAAAAAAAAARGGGLPASPFDAPAASAASDPAQLAQQAGRPSRAQLLMYQHSMVRLQSRVARSLSAGTPTHPGSSAEGLAAAEAGLGGRGEPGGGVPDAEPEQVLEGPGDVRGRRQSGPKQAAAQGAAAIEGSAIRVVASFHPLLTPSGCAAAGKLPGPPVSPQKAAEIYAGKMEPVDHGTLRQAQRISRFAVAAYGLQGVIWARGQRPAMCLANLNRLVKCFKKPLGLESKFRKRNFNTLLQMTGVAPADLLYVSYANVAGGVLPYLLMLHRPSKSVVLSVRGTVSMEDLITDLLSNPVDVSDWVPDWVRDEACARRQAGIAGDASGASLKAHIGIVSSATAILKDLEDRGLLREMLLSKLLRAATLAGRDSQAVIAEFLAGQHGGQVPDVPAQPDGMKRRAAQLGRNPAAAAAAGAAGGARSNGGGAPQFAEEEERHLSRLQGLGEEREVELPLERAQTILRSKLQLQGWKVVVTGHSLGAAVATLLGMQLRERFADLQCWAFNPPGGLLSWELAQVAQRYCTSVVVGKDVISRLSFNTSKRVVDEMVVSLARCKRPKLKVLLDVTLGRRKRPASTPATFVPFEEVAPEALQLVEQYYRASHLHMQGADTTEMYPPGKLIFMRPFKGKKKQQTVWDAVWVDAATLISEGILVTPTMMAHHRLFVLAEAFESIFAGEVATDAAPPDEQEEEEDLMFQ